MSATHTPLPWAANVFLVVAPNGRSRYSTLYGGQEICHTGGGRCPSEEAEANARFIVRAVNAHDELVAALRLLPLDKPFEDASDYKDNAKHFAAAMDAARSILNKIHGA